MLFVV